MRNWITALFVAVSLAGIGCTHHDDDHMAKNKMSGDACSHCAGMQKATADGKCPGCGMKLSMGNDACPNCPGVQTARADGTCPGCGQKPM